MSMNINNKSDFVVREAYGPRFPVTVTFSKPSLTKQHFKEESDVNNIIRKHGLATIQQHAEIYKGSYGDFSALLDYRECMNKVAAANEMFMTLPSSVRKRFLNDAATFVIFASDPNNRPELVKLGLATPLPEEASSVVENPQRDSDAGGGLSTSSAS